MRAPAASDDRQHSDHDRSQDRNTGRSAAETTGIASPPADAEAAAHRSALRAHLAESKRVAYLAMIDTAPVSSE